MEDEKHVLFKCFLGVEGERARTRERNKGQNANQFAFDVTFLNSWFPLIRPNDGILEFV